MFRHQHMNMQCKNDKQNRKQIFSTKILPNRNSCCQSWKAKKPPETKNYHILFTWFPAFLKLPQLEGKLCRQFSKTKYFPSTCFCRGSRFSHLRVGHALRISFILTYWGSLGKERCVQDPRFKFNASFASLVFAGTSWQTPTSSVFHHSSYFFFSRSVQAFSEKEKWNLNVKLLCFLWSGWGFLFGRVTNI